MVQNIYERYSDADLQEFNKLIEKKLENAKMEFDFTNNQISELNGNSKTGGDFMEESNKQSELELLNNMAIRHMQFIRNLENALIRIRNKTYGVCTVTGQLIDKNRLKLVPHATKSIAGKNHEQSKVIRASEKKSDAKLLKPKIYSKVIRKNTSNNKNSIPVSVDWETNEEDDFDIMKFDFEDGEQKND